MAKLGYQYLVSAAERYHDGLANCIAQLRFPKASHPPRWCNGQPMRYLTTAFQHRLLTEHFSEHLKWATMASEHEVAQVCKPLAHHWRRRFDHWGDLAASFGLLSPRKGRKQHRQASAIIEALDFFDAHSRWPKVHECSMPLRRLRFNEGKTTWEVFVSTTTFDWRIARQLKDRWLKHLRKQRGRNPESKQRILKTLFRLVIQSQDPSTVVQHHHPAVS